MSELIVDDGTLLIRIADVLLEQDLPDLSPNQRTFRLIWELEAQVNNGGFNQYFFNTSGREALQAPEALTAIGANLCSEVVARALAIAYTDNIDWRSDLARQELLEAVDPDMEAFSELDARFYEYPDPLSELLAAFVKLNPADFEALSA